MARTIGIGNQDFETIRREGYFYIDKTDLIRQWWESGDGVTLITRPRRFGKTLNMSMLEKFFSVDYKDRGDLFCGLKIWESKKYIDLQGTYPVIFLSFAGVKESTYADARESMCRTIEEQYNKYDRLLNGDLLNEREKAFCRSISANMSDSMAAASLRALSDFLGRYYGKKTIILLDEYDTPMQEAYVNGYWAKMVAFTRSLFNATFKTNPYLERAVMTGITRVSKESIFSDLNNLEVVTTTSEKYSDCFGFTEDEVFAVLEEYGLSDQKQKVKDWYDGFSFGKRKDIYNPWSIVSFINKKGKYDTYWSNTSGNGLVNQLIQKGNPDIKQTMEDLLQGNSFEAEIDEKIVFDQLNGSADAVWSLLLATGYLKVLNVRTLDMDEEGLGAEGDVWYTLTITNLETKRMFRKMIKDWFKNDTEVYYNEFIKALLNDNVKKMNTFMNKVALNTFSFFDSGNKPSDQTEPERFYHGFVLGMVVNLSDTYKVRSNRESGFGRYDVMIEPFNKTKKAYILEFKVLDSDEDEETLEDTLANAHAQIEEKQYEAELISSGYLPEQIRKYGFAFRGKECLIG